MEKELEEKLDELIKVINKECDEFIAEFGSINSKESFISFLKKCVKDYDKENNKLIFEMPNSSTCGLYLWMLEVASMYTKIDFEINYTNDEFFTKTYCDHEFQNGYTDLKPEKEKNFLKFFKTSFIKK